ncbi:MAG: 30S ribosomal protein S24e [Halobacteriaceae archaeon]
MEIDIIEEEENPLLHRTDVTFRITHEEETPSRLSVRDSLAATFDRDSEEVVIRSLDTRFGMRETIGEAKIYESPDAAVEIEADHMLDRNKIEGQQGEDVAEEAE